MEVIELKAAREYVLANYPNDPLLKHIALSLLEQMPKVEAAEVVHGRNLKEEWPSLFECSVCGCDSVDTYSFEPSTINYCPNCGAKMDGGADGE